MATTIKDIAALAGVSRGTVDRVLNNRGSVNPATAEKINEIAKALDYKPNKAAGACRSKKETKTRRSPFFHGQPLFC